MQLIRDGFVVMVLGAADNVLFVPAKVFAGWVKGLEPSGSGTWPMVFYESLDRRRIERWVPGKGRKDVTALRNDYAALRRLLAESQPVRAKGGGASVRVADLLEAGLLSPGDTVYTRKCPDLRATIVDAETVSYKGKRWSYNDWGMHVTGWTAINIYLEFVLARTGQTFDELREKLRHEHVQ